MPVPHREAPEFNAYGRYAIDTRERKLEGPTKFHDLDNMVEGCGVASAPDGSLSRFNNSAWAVQRGYQPCGLCSNDS